MTWNVPAEIEPFHPTSRWLFGSCGNELFPEGKISYCLGTPIWRKSVGGLFSRVRTGPGKPGKSWNFSIVFSRTGKSRKVTTGPGKFWKSVINWAKKYEVYGRQ